MGLRSYVYPDRALRRAQRKQMRRRGQQRHANYGGSCVDRETTDTGDSDDENNAEEDTFGFDLFLGGLYEKFLIRRAVVFLSQ